MANNTKLISGGINYFLAGGSAQQIPYAGSATPWTVQTTTPFELSLNDVTGSTYTPAPAPSLAILGGGPPFRPGRSLVTKSYDVVTEPVGIQMRATSHDNAVALLRLLRQVLNTAMTSSSCILAVQPDGATAATYFEILYADVPEKPDYLWESTSTAVVFRATITWTRSIGSAGALTTLINAVSMRNRSSSSPDDVEAFSTVNGDLANEGQPLNLSIAPAASSDIDTTAYIATIYERVNTSAAQAKTTTTLTNYTAVSATITNARNRNLKVRLLARFTTFTAASKIKFHVEVATSVGTVFYTSPLQALPAATATSTLMDFGYFDVGAIRSIAGSTLALSITFFIHSIDLTSVTATLDYVETLLYYTFATTTGFVEAGEVLVIEQANDYNLNGIIVPTNPPRVYATLTNDWRRKIAYVGALPRAINGASLYLAWLSGGTDNTTHDTADTATVTAQYLPVYQTLRGNGS